MRGKLKKSTCRKWACASWKPATRRWLLHYAFTSQPTGQKLCFPYCWHVIGSCWLSGWDRGSWRDTSELPRADLCITQTHTHPDVGSAMNPGPWGRTGCPHPQTGGLLCCCGGCYRRSRLYKINREQIHVVVFGIRMIFWYWEKENGTVDSSALKIFTAKSLSSLSSSNQRGHTFNYSCGKFEGEETGFSSFPSTINATQRPLLKNDKIQILFLIKHCRAHLTITCRSA